MVVAARSELPAILAVQHDAFGRVARMLTIDRDSLPPLNETLGDLEALYDSGTVFFAALSTQGNLVGSVRGERREETVEIGRLVVASKALRRGIGTALMHGLEATFGDARRFELFTGAEAREPLALYGKLGYRVYARRTEGAVPLVWLEKQA